MSKIKMPIEKSHIMMFARSIGDSNPKYYKEDGNDVVAPPTFIQASAQFDPDYFLRPKIGGENWFGSGKESSGMKSSGGGGGGAAMGLHAEQHYEYHQPLKVGDVITAEVKVGNSWEKESKRAGKLKFSESVTEYRNQNGDLIITATSVGVVTEKPVEN
ncbi:MAG: hypothetical protein DBW95_03475 [Gammaproteobacteria bacterium]|nr:MAG: hypothetical protein DBW95_03475 [Gammaproteobacteria bacterium]|tara:strand:- start:1068 stop:1544 length:477 start_codon:yes stop_codon:yes gene_type:complete